MNIDQPKVSDITERIVAIVRFGPPTASDGFRPAEYYQITIDPQRFSPCGAFIRFGTYPGDEIMGWQRADCLYVMSEIAKWPDEIDNPALPWGRSPALTEIH
jgi:hypothetical protein